MSASEQAMPAQQVHYQANFRVLTVSLLAALIGCAAGVVAFLLYNLIALFTNLFFYQRLSFTFVGVAENHLGLWVLVVPVIGGLVVGLMAKYGTSKIKGHGIPEAMEAVLFNRSRIAPRVAILKPISAAIAIGTGGPFGAEGPIIQTGGALGSLIGQAIHVTPAERKVLLACGAAAGMAATFNSPIAAVILAIELLLFEFKSRSFIPLVIASTMATGVHDLLMGRGPMFTVGAMDFGIPSGLPFYLVLGVICGGAAVILSCSLYWIEDQFERLPVDSMWWPAIGAIALGIIGYFVPRVLGVGYDTISDILSARLPLVLLLVIMVFKTLALIISLGSGTSGGLLAPTFMASAALGGAFALIVNQIVPGAHLDPGAYALVAMAAVFGAASRATFTFIVFAFEITRNYEAILPLMLVSVIADGVAIPLMRNSIMTEKLARRGLRVEQDYEVDTLSTILVSDVMTTDVVTIPQTMTVGELIGKINQHDPRLTRHQALLIVDENNALRGIITRGDVLNAINRGQADDTVLEAGTKDPIVAYPTDSVREALGRMLQKNIGRLPVVDPKQPTRLVGYLSRSNVMAAHMKRIQEERVVEAGWVRSPRAILSGINGSSSKQTVGEK